MKQAEVSGSRAQSTPTSTIETPAERDGDPIQQIQHADPVAHAARRAARQTAAGLADPEPSLGRRLGQIGILGWTVVVPTLMGLVLGRWLDRHFASGVFFSAPLLMLGAALGLWSAWRWMHKQGGSQ